MQACRIAFAPEPFRRCAGPVDPQPVDAAARDIKESTMSKPKTKTDSLAGDGVDPSFTPKATDPDGKKAASTQDEDDGEEDGER